MGIELRDRGHRVTLATNGIHEAKVRGEGLAFVAVRPEISLKDSAMLAYVMDARRGSERVVRFLASAVRESYADTLDSVKQADLVVTHPVTFGAGLAVEMTGVPWVSSVLAPLSFLSVYDPSVPAPAPWLVNLRALGPGPVRLLKRISYRYTAPWVQPVADLRKELGLPAGRHPLFEGQHAPRLVLALFASCLARPQPDWPAQTVVTGFPFFDGNHREPALTPEVERFLSSGPAPLVFSLGSSAVAAAGDFYTESLQAAHSLGMRALFLTGQHRQGLPSTAMALEYAPHSLLFPRAAAIVHHGGVGTTAQAMRSGRPMLIVPFSHDQFDNGARAKQLGIAEVLYRSRFTARRAARMLRLLTEDPRYAQAGARVAAQVRCEHGTRAAADAIEAIILS